MNTRRIVIDLKPAGWLGWLLLALLAIPLLVLFFFFITVALVLVAVMVALAAVRICWLRRKARSRDPSVHRNQRSEIIDVEPVDITRVSDAGNAVSPNTLPPRLP